jgi:MerR family transcriptional regulator, light-induced transcriptional regulator
MPSSSIFARTETAPAPVSLADRLAHRYAEALQAGSGRAAAAVVRRGLDAGLSPADVHHEVIAPGMRAIGALWEAGELSVAAEHLATAITHRVMADVYDELVVGAPRGRERVLVSGLPGQHHVLGLRMVADQLEGDGFDVRFLGADVPVRDLLTAVERQRPAFVALSVVLDEEIPQARATIGQLRTAVAGLPVLVGGPAAGPELAREGVELVLDPADLTAAVERALLQSPAPVAGAPIDFSLPERPGHADDGSLESRFAENATAMGEIVRQRTRRAAEYLRLAHEDALTGLPNRRALEDHLDHLSVPERAARSVLMVDLDRFKVINDQHGHHVGDQVLERVARIIRGVCRAGDFAARYGGDEFAIVLEAEPEAAAGVGEALRVAVAADDGVPAVTASIGVSGFSGDLRATTLRADMALYRAKARGRNGVELTG